MGRLVWWNGEYIKESEARVSIFDSALQFGDTVFEMTRSFNKNQFKLQEHLDRLYASAKYFEIPLSIDIGDMYRYVMETIEKNSNNFSDDDEYRVLINITRGLLPLYQNNIDIPNGINVIISVFPLRWTVRGMGKLFDTGINAVIPSQRTIPASLLEPKVKNRSRVHYMMANLEVAKYDGNNNWPLLLDPDGFIAEGPGYNFFIVKDNNVITPEPRNILRGISREYIKELLQSKYFIGTSMNFVEKNIEVYDVIFSDEAFVTATPFCVLPIVSINKIKIGDGYIGRIYNRLLHAWSSNVSIDIRQQIKKWDNIDSVKVVKNTTIQQDIDAEKKKK